MMDVCPLVFEPIFRPKIWGGRNLARLLDKPLPPDSDIGESWECADLDGGQSVVNRGPARGRSLGDLVREWGTALLGRAHATDGSFPLLIKFLDASDNLSIQVHPDAEAAARLGLSILPKDEAWHVIEARQGAAIYRGFREGVTLEAFASALEKDPPSIVAMLHRTSVRSGETYYVPSGTVHAIGAGVVVAEVQTPVDVTYRLYDWGRRRPQDDAGLHLTDGLACIRQQVDFAPFEKRSHVTSVFTTVTRLVTCPSFILERVRFVGEIEQPIPYAEPVIWIVLEGRGEILYGKNGVETFAKGDVVLLPAALKEPRLKTLSDCVWLEVTIPAPSDLAEYDRPSAAALRAPDGSPGAPMPLNISIQRP